MSGALLALLGYLHRHGRRVGAWFVGALLVTNGVVSVIGAAITAYRLDWVLSAAGFVGVVAWNVLMLAASLLAAAAWRARLARSARGRDDLRDRLGEIA